MFNVNTFPIVLVQIIEFHRGLFYIFNYINIQSNRHCCCK